MSGVRFRQPLQLRGDKTKLPYTELVAIVGEEIRGHDIAITDEIVRTVLELTIEAIVSVVSQAGSVQVLRFGTFAAKPSKLTGIRRLKFRPTALVSERVKANANATQFSAID